MENPNIKLVESYLDALRTKDLSKAPVASDIRFEDPLTEPREGIDAWREFVSPMLPAFNEVRIRRHIAEGDYVATHWEADTAWGVIPVFEYFRIKNGRIAEARAFLDPRPITNASST
jgi:predicted ester cyclase